MDAVSSAFLISHGLNSLIALLLVVTTLRLYLKTRIATVMLQTILMTSWSLTNLLLILPLILGISDPSNSLVIGIAGWNIIGSSIVPSVFILFIDSFEGKIDPRKTALAVSTMVGATIIAIVGVFLADISIASTIVVPSGSELVTMRWSPLASLLIFPTVLICGYWTRNEINYSLQFAYNSQQIRQLRLMRIGGLLMFFVGPIFGILGVIFVDGLNDDIVGTWLSEIIGYLFVSVGIFMVTIAYIQNDAPSFLQPQRMQKLLVMYSTGIPVFEYSFREQEDEPDTMLVSGAMTAITAIMGEAFNVTTNVKQIAFHEKELMVHFEGIADDEVAFILITDRVSSFLEISLARFAHNISQAISQRDPNRQLSAEEETVFEQKLLQDFGLTSEYYQAS